MILTFAEYIRKLPPSTVYESMLRPGGLNRRIISSSLVDEIEKRHGTAEAVACRFESLSEDAKNACVAAYLMGEEGIPAAGLEKIRDELLRSFLVCLMRDSRARFFWAGFKDQETLLRPLLAGELIKKSMPDENVKTTQHHISGNRFILDFTVLCSMASQGVLQTTHTGNLERISSNSLKQLINGLPTGVIFESREVDEKAVASLLIKFGVSHGILIHDRNAFHLNQTKFERWLSMPASEQSGEFSAFAMYDAGRWNPELFLDAAAKAGNRVFQFDAISLAAERPVFRNALRNMTYCGLIRASGRGAKILLSKAEPAVPVLWLTDAEIKVLPDFSAILPGEISPLSMFGFSCVGTFKNLDHIYKGVIERKNVNHSLGNGTDPEKILNQLKRFRTPENVTATVIEWIREFSRVALSDECICISADERTTRQLESYEPIRKLLTKIENAHAVYIVRRGKEGAAREILSGMGFDARFPRVPVEKSEPQSPPGFEVAPTPALTPVVDFNLEKPNDPIADVRTGKYSSELKRLETGDIYHVIEYAILMGRTIKVDYEGDAGCRKGIYSVRPLAVKRGRDACIEVIVISTDKKRELDVKLIKRIGVAGDVEGG